MELARQSKFSIDATVEVEVLAYEYTGSDPREILARVDIGDASKPIQGGGSYQLKVYIDDVLIVPVSSVSVPSGNDKAIFVSRPILLESGDDVSIRVIGLAGDSDINSIATLRDATSLKRSDLIGSGSNIVDHDYGGEDALAVMTRSGARIDQATIRAYLAADYNAGRRGTEFLVSQTTTNVEGRWVSPMMLDAGDYVLIIFKQGAIETKMVTLTVE